MSHVAIITGISGRDFYLDREGKTTEAEKRAKPFRSPESAAVAAKAHIDAQARVCAKYMSYRVEPRA